MGMNQTCVGGNPFALSYVELRVHAERERARHASLHVAQGFAASAPNVIFQKKASSMDALVCFHVKEMHTCCAAAVLRSCSVDDCANLGTLSSHRDLKQHLFEACKGRSCLGGGHLRIESTSNLTVISLILVFLLSGRCSSRQTELAINMAATRNELLKTRLIDCLICCATQIIAAQPAERQAALSQCLVNLMHDVQRNLEPRNRDKFTQVRTFAFTNYRSAHCVPVVRATMSLIVLSVLLRSLSCRCAAELTSRAAGATSAMYETLLPNARRT
jgi:hypothetical protein